MKVEYVSPFVEAAVKVMTTLLQVTPERGTLSARPQVFTTQQVNIVCGITGDVEGQVIFGMSIVAADRIASRMLGSPVVTFDQLAASAIAELGNMISGNSMTLLHGQGFTCDITPPTIIKGSNVKISTLDIPALVIPMRLKDIGEFEINVSIKERTRRAA
ncbi:MAG TPA: chemotaxis protein CheX [Fimbriimonadaceae bacterium]|jgi:chemotaxis protein CheX|nr:chemotaxis protein CheX [Armatimonadota bacterium]HCM74574.1 chemotaxis protein CheX [Armatimonadota bacterium]HRD30762.1 chemotaxis protein CheX [Fimbriimonadaceae bacterium]HRE94733.1 chemotaxis protein CheX [Fimbriimonadaceae bacterium]HRI75074.1 chemotaxis protein CheX [Fimbriimonadaceae bacterium]